jgi:hypothetical protein
MLETTGTEGRPLTPFEKYVLKLGWPVLRGVGFSSTEDVVTGPSSMENTPPGVIFDMDGLQGLSGVSMIDLPVGWAPQAWDRHLYEKWYLVFEGSGTIEFQGSDDGAEVSFDWKKNSLVAIPLNMRHRLKNTGTDRARILIVDNAPLYMDLLGSWEVVFAEEQVFSDREDRALKATEPVVDFRMRSDHEGQAPVGWYKHILIEDVVDQELQDGSSIRGKGFNFLALDMSGGILGAHIGEIPPQTLTNAHCHMGGALLVCVKGRGYSLAWHGRAGQQPYEEGNESEVKRQDYGYSGQVAVGIEWYHQHANPYEVPFRQVAFRYGEAPALFNLAHHLNGGTGRKIPLEQADKRIPADFEAMTERVRSRSHAPH